MTPRETIVEIALLAAGTFFAYILRRGWRAQGGERRRISVWMGWGIFIVAILAATTPLGKVRGPFVALPLLCTGALALVAQGAQIRPLRKRAAADSKAKPSERSPRGWRATLRRWMRGWSRGLLAGPVGLIAASGLGLAWAQLVPGRIDTRIVVGGSLIPALWAGAVAWTLSDTRLLRVATGLIGISLLTYGAYAAKRFL